ncbi:MAG: D-alanyl-D-alanine carboxypeptidase family protein [Bacillota bacterium]|nr:D-alanyl-D-alanine carboxypeptidase family protein [Bacillota bacterium]
MFIFSIGINTFASQNSTVHIKSEAAVLIDSETGAVLFSQNPNERLYPASLTKIATAIYALEKGNLNDTVTVSHNAVKADGTRVYLVEGEKIPFKTLIQGMLINSGNDAAIAVAEHLDGKLEKFAQHLNEYLIQNIGVKNTHFVNPNGLFNANHYSTAMDLATITSYAMKNAEFAEIFGMKQLKWNGQAWKTTLRSHHLMLTGEVPYKGITGGKTGYLDESKHTLATTADNGRMKLTLIELSANHKKDIYKDTVKLLDYGFNKFKHEKLIKNEHFKFGKHAFFLGSDTVVTIPAKGAAYQVNDFGSLAIQDRKGNILQFVDLKASEKSPKKKAVTKGLKKRRFFIWTQFMD